MTAVTREQARAAAKRLTAQSKDFQLLVIYLARRAGMNKTPYRDDVNDTHRQIGRQEQHQVLQNLINQKRGSEE